MNFYNLYQTNNNKIVVVGQTPREWYTVVFHKLPEALLPEFTSDINVVTQASSFLYKVFNLPVNQSPDVTEYDTQNSLTITKDLSLLSVNYNFVPYALDAIDKGNITLKEYLLKSFVCEFDLVDFKPSIKNETTTNVIDSKSSWLEIPVDKHFQFNNYGLTDALYEEIKDSDTFQTIISYINAIDPVSPYKNILLKGPRASGKTTLVQAVAKYYDLPYAVLTATNRKTVDDIGGMLAPNEETTGWKKEEAHLATVLKAGGVAFIDELNMSTYDFQVGGLNSILDGSRFFTFYNESFKVHQQTIFFAAMNEGYQGNNILNESTESRFLPIYMDKISLENIAKYQSKELGVDYDDYFKFVSYIQNLSDNITKTFEEENTVYPYPPEINPRLISKIYTMSKQSSFSQIIPQIIRAVLSDPCYSKTAVEAFIKSNMVEFQSMNVKTAFVDTTLKEESQKLFDEIFDLPAAPDIDPIEEINKKLKDQAESFKELFK